MTEEEKLFRDNIARQVFTADLESVMRAADYGRAVRGLARRAYAAADAMLSARTQDAAS